MHMQGYGGSGMVVRDHDGAVRMSTLCRGTSDVRMDFLDAANTANAWSSTLVGSASPTRTAGRALSWARRRG